MKRALALAIVITLSAASCTAATTDTTAPRTLTVFAASSLGPAFTELAHVFESTNPGVTVVLNLGSSTDLAGQIASEGTADVFASASETAMDTVSEDPGVEGRSDFATNRLVIITPPDDPAGVASIEDLANGGVQLVLGAEGVPVGDYARQALDSAGILDAALANVVSDEQDDASVVAKIESGEADAAIVYTSDVTAGADVRAVRIDPDVNVIAAYPIAVVQGSPNADLAARFIEQVTLPYGLKKLAAFGFGPPPSDG